MKIKLKLKKYTFNRQGNISANNHLCMVSRQIKDLIEQQEDKFNGYNIAHVRDDVLNPGPWTLHFDGHDFWFEGSQQLIDHNELGAAE